MQSLHTRNSMKSHNTYTGKRTYYAVITYSALQSKKSIKKKDNQCSRYLIFPHTNRPDSLASLSQNRKARLCTPCIDACSAHSMHHLPYRFLGHLIASAYFINFLQLKHMGIRSLMPQEVPENPEIHNDAIRSRRDLHSRQYRTTQAQVTCSMTYRLPNSRYRIPCRCNISWRSRSRTSQSFSHSVARSTIGLPSYLKSWTSIRSFLQASHRCMA